MKTGYFEMLSDKLDREKKIDTFRSEIITDIRHQTTFETGLKLPLSVEGTLITAGQYQDGYVPPEELKRVASGFKGILIWKAHPYAWNVHNPNFVVPIDAIVGRINETYYDDDSESIKWKGEIDDDGIALRIVRGLIKSVSVGFTNQTKFIHGRKSKVDIIPKELSLVYDPKDPNASIRVS